MRRKFHLYFFIIVFASCKSLKNVTARDNPASTKSGSASGNAVFLDDISVTPGGKSRTVSKSSPTTKTYGHSANANKNRRDANASELQLKYASLLNVPIEELTNTRLFFNIEYWWGTKYCLGGSTEDCTDCSAFTKNLMYDVYAINIPRTAAEQYKTSTHIKTKSLKQGDLVFFQNSRHTVTHVGMYVANNKFVHASVSNGVMISDLDDAYWKKRYKGAGRVLR
jgi:lipoprotein Spr